MPALQKCADLKYVGIACSSAEEWFGEALAETDPTSIAEVKEREPKIHQTSLGFQ